MLLTSDEEKMLESNASVYRRQDYVRASRGRSPRLLYTLGRLSWGCAVSVVEGAKSHSRWVPLPVAGPSCLMMNVACPVGVTSAVTLSPGWTLVPSIIMVF